MKCKRFSEEQIIGVLKESEAGMPTPELCRRHGISEGAFYRRKLKFGGMEVSDAKKLKALEEETVASSGWLPTRQWTFRCLRM